MLITKYFPNWVDTHERDDPPKYEFNSLQELWGVPFAKQKTEYEDFERFTISHLTYYSLLSANYENGEHWIVGIIKGIGRKELDLIERKPNVQQPTR